MAKASRSFLPARRAIRALGTTLLGAALVAACTVGAPDGAPLESQKTLDELLATAWDDLSDADRDKLALLTGQMSQPDYDAIYHPDRALDTERSDPQALTLEVGKWRSVDIPGAVCGNGSQYRIFINYAKDPVIRASNKLTVYFEPGGACWDYESCTGQTGIRGAANPNGIPENHMSFIDYLNPFKSGGSPMPLISPIIWKGSPSDRSEVATWNKVFFPYCTGDVHSGNRVVTYEDPTGQNPPLTFHHVGATNVEKAIEYLKNEFPQPERMLVAGCSAGGAGALTNYHFLRKGMAPQESFLLNDSGPIFPAPGTGNHYPLHQTIRENWNVDYIIGKYSDIPGFDVLSDYGLISEAIATAYPDDQLAITLFKRDRTYSGYSYARPFDLDENDPADREEILRLWAEDIESMVAQYDRHDNLSYFVPYMRNINDSHCTTIINWTGTEIEDTGIEVGNFIDDLLDGGDVASYHEIDNPDDENVSDFWLTLVRLVLG